MLLKTLLIFILIAVLETANGIARMNILTRRIGRRRAGRWSLVSGMFLILIVTWFSLPWIHPVSLREALAIGLLWALLMAAYDFAIGRWAFRLRWRRIFADFDPRRGNLLSFGLLWILLIPALVYLLQN